ncbi:MAG: DUF1311 domain-containing protein [Gammaproteobacteria bacterium]|nr:DUF1311 domain-containing protein [Gammaproteobacteria bacterium]
MYKITKTILFILSLSSFGLQAASFDCKRAATKIETMICQDKELSVFDEVLSNAYNELRNLSTDIELSSIKTDQRNWLKVRNNSCGTIASCIKAYSLRIVELKKLTSSERSKENLHAMSRVNASEQLDCANASTTLEINECLSLDLDSANQVMRTYLDKSLEQKKNDPVSVESIKQSQAAWIAYRDAQCGAVFDTWRTGPIRVSMDLECRLELTYIRTRVLWASFLTYMDSTPPVLPEPKL